MRKTAKRLIATLLMVILAVTLFAGCTNGKTEGAVLKLGLDASFPPMGFKDDKGVLVGFDLDVATEAVKLMDGYTSVKFVPIEWSVKDTELDAGNIDMIWNGFTMHVDNRDEAYEWTTPYMKNKMNIVVKEGSPIKAVADLKGKIVVAQAGSSGLDAAKGTPALMDNIAKLNEVPNYENAMMELESGSADAIVVDKIVIEYKIAQGKKGVRILEETLKDEEYGVAFKKGNTDLRDKLQTALNTMAENGKLAEISTKWFGEDITVIGK